MISFFTKNAQSLIIAIILIVIIEMIVPDGANKKYIKIISGLYILVTFLNPFLSLINKDIDIDFLEELKSMEASSEATIDYKQYYLNSLKDAIKVELKEKGFVIQDIDIELNDDCSEISKILIKGCKYNQDELKRIFIESYGVKENNIWFI